MEKETNYSDKLEKEYGASADDRGKTNSDIIKKAQEKTAEENEKRAVEEAQRNIAKSDYIKERTLLENRQDKAKAANKNKYTKAICEASDKYKAGEIDADEQTKLIKEADKELRKANDEAETKFSTEIRKLRDANPTGYRASEWC